MFYAEPPVSSQLTQEMGTHSLVFTPAQQRQKLMLLICR